MARLTLGAQTLIAQVSAKKKRTKVTPYGEPDGIRVHRSIQFNKATGLWLAPLLEVIEDPRIESIDPDDSGLIVTFVPTIHADTRDPFPLDEAEAVLR